MKKHHLFKVIRKVKASDGNGYIVTLECVHCSHVEVKRVKV